MGFNKSNYINMTIMFMLALNCVAWVSVALVAVDVDLNAKYLKYTEHSCINLRMTHACKVMKKDYVWDLK